MLSFEIGQRESGFYSERTDRQTDRITESPNHPVPYYYIDINAFHYQKVVKDIKIFKLRYIFFLFYL